MDIDNSIYTYGQDSINFDEDNSNDGLKIDIKPSPKRKTKKELTIQDKQILDAVENNIEDILEEKAAKSNLSTNNVKEILKHVFTNEHVLALVRQTETLDSDTVIPYEPKLTRSKAKEFLTSSPVLGITSIPWTTPTSSKVQAFISEDILEDSSGDEYVPLEEESEDDKDLSLLSASSSVTLQNIEESKLPCSGDDIFKIPKGKNENDTNIALRTRSKLSLSSTPLEVIEEAFIPPDITTDMYDMDCCDEDWRDFLKAFTRPLDEAKANEDDDHDPEYNILADEEIDEVDREELRADKAVKVTRKELNGLMVELFEYVDIYSGRIQTGSTKENDITENSQYSIQINEASSTIENSIKISDSSFLTTRSCEISTSLEKSKLEDKTTKAVSCGEISSNGIFNNNQLLLLEQQMRQHVQMLTQYYLLTFEHADFNNLASQFKEYLLNLKFLANGNDNSFFLAINLKAALDLIENWENMFITSNKDVIETIQYFTDSLKQAVENLSENLDYQLNFPPFLLKIISESDVFIYPYLLPKTPFKNAKLSTNRYEPYSQSEEQLIALGLEQFIPYLSLDKSNLTNRKLVSLRKTSHFIQKYLIPGRSELRVYRHICDRKLPRNVPNPIKYYFQQKKAPPTYHHVTPLDKYKILPPCKRPFSTLPVKWKQYLNSVQQENRNFCSISPFSSVGTVINLTVQKKDTRRKSRQKYILPNCSIITSTPKKVVRRIFFPSTTKATSENVRTKFLQCLSRSVPLSKLLSISSTETEYNSVNRQEAWCSDSEMLPSMPNLCNSKECAKDSDTNNITCAFVELPSSHNDINLAPIESSQHPIETANVTFEKEICHDTQNEADNIIVKKLQDNRLNVSKAKSKLIQKRSAKSNLSKEFDKSKNSSADGSILRKDGNILEKDNIDDINALMIASATVKNTQEKKNISAAAEKRKAKIRKEYLANLALLSSPDPVVENEKRDQFAQAYFDKLKDTLEADDHRRIMDIFENVNLSTGDAVDLYKRIEPILCPKYRDMADEFLLFLTNEQANAIGRLIPFYIMNNMSKFLSKLEIYFKDQPSQIRKIYRSLVDLNQCVDVTIEKVKTTILPLLKGNSLLNDWFLQIFLEERPPPMLLNGTWEEIDVNKELSKPEDEAAFETMVMPDVEDPYGGLACICMCHKLEAQPAQVKQHCVKCGLRFMQGKMYVQTGKGLRPVSVAFPSSPNVNHSNRLNVKVSNQKKKRTDTTGRRVTSPTKEHHDEVRGNNESEEDDKRKRARGKSPRKTKPKQLKPPSKIKDSLTKTCKKTSKKSCDKNSLAVIKTVVPRKGKSKSVKPQTPTEKKTVKPRKTDKSKAEMLGKPGTSIGQVKRTADDALNWKNCPSPEYLSIPSSDGESCHDFAHNTNERELVLSASTNLHTEMNCETSWTREEDKTILETFQQRNNKEKAFQHISGMLKNRSVTEIKNRFQKLMSLLQQMASIS